jgi:catechol 2,3-dioxygenase-like lactoylglutathione lyase family enzyme
MFDHVSMKVRDLSRSKKFYSGALAPLGYGVEYEDASTIGLGPKGAPALWLGVGEAKSPVHIALTASNRAAVDAFYKAALAAGGRDNGASGLRPQYHQHYYGAFVLDPDGNNVEAVCHKPE